MISGLLRKAVVGIAACIMLCIFALAAETATVTANGGLNFRSAASSSASIICTIPNGASVTVSEKGSEWCKIGYDGNSGYVMTKYLKFPVYGNLCTVTVSAANIREYASETSACLATVYQGASVTYSSLHGGWYQVKHGNITGFIRGDLVKASGTAPKAEASPAPKSAVPSSGSASGNQKRTELINFAASLLGTPYRSGGETPGAGFDCSGFTYYVFGKFGYSLPRGPASQMNALGTSISKSELKPGDLLFFKNPYNGRSIGHVGIYVGNGQMIHSNKPGGSVRYVTIQSGYYLTNYVGARRVIFD